MPPKIVQAISLCLGFIGGQGLYFFANSILVVQGELAIIGSIGIALGILTLIQAIGDCGGVYFWGKAISLGKFEKDFLSFIAARIAVMLGFFIAIFFIFSLIEYDFVLTVWVLAVLNGLLWSANLSGVFDYLGLNKWISLFSSFNWVFAALILIFFPVYRDVFSISLAYTFGTFITVLLHWLYYFRIKSNKIYFRFSVFDFVVYARHFFWFSLGFGVAQLYSRIIPVMVFKLVGADFSGIYVFSKNFTNAVGQIFVFLRRVTYSDFVKEMNVNPRLSAIDLIKANLLPVVYLLGLSLLSFFVLIFVYFYYYGDNRSILLFTCLMTGILVIWGVSQTYSMALISRNLNSDNTKIFGISSVFGVLLSWVSLVFFGVYSLIIVELLVYLIIVFLAKKTLREKVAA